MHRANLAAAIETSENRHTAAEALIRSVTGKPAMHSVPEVAPPCSTPIDPVELAEFAEQVVAGMREAAPEDKREYVLLDHPFEVCSRPHCLVEPIIQADGRVSHHVGYHRSCVSSQVIEYGHLAQVSVGRDEEMSLAVVHVRVVEEFDGDDDFRTVLEPDEADALAALLTRAADLVRRERAADEQAGYVQ